jgi:tryptophan synthase alpha chain
VSIVESGIDSAIAHSGGALIGYLPLGFPTIDGSVEAAITLAKSGCDVLELGLPYSDPVMDGLVIQQATTTALENGFRISDAFVALKQITAEVDTPALVMTYWNPVLAYGVDRFASDLKNAGGAGLITPDLIPDEAHLWKEASAKFDLDRVFLAAPSSSDERIDQAIEASRGFVYAVSTMGITGTRNDVDSAAVTLVKRLRAHGATHIGVGLGISSADQVSEVLSYADGAIVGSALVQALAAGGVTALAEKALELAAGKPGPASAS